MRRGEADPGRASRHNIRILGRLTLDGKGSPESYMCNTVNLSLSGAFIETGSSLPVGALFKYSFSLPGADSTVSVTGEIVRGERIQSKSKVKARPGEEAKRLHRYGIMFLDMTEEDRKAIEDYFLGR